VLLTNHVLSGALIGVLVRRPVPAFAAGVASHFVLDSVPHWGQWGSQRRFLRVAVADGLVSLAIVGALTAASPPERRAAVLGGMAGAALPDADKPARLWFGRSPFPSAVDRFHARIQDEAPHRAPAELAAAGVFAAAALTAIRGVRTRGARRLQRVLQADQGGEIAEGDLEHRRRVFQREAHVAEHLHRHRPVQHRPAAQEREHRAERDGGA
jgi:hypothetical protein